MAEKIKTQAKDKLVWIARIGYCTRGIVYIVVGGLAVLAAFGQGGKTTGTKGALQTVMSSPFGNVLIAIIAMGLFSYAFWRVVQSIKDTDDHGKTFKGLTIRTGLLVSATTHALLGVYAVKMLVGSGEEKGNGSADMAAKLMQQPWGSWLAYFVAVCILGVAIAHVIKAFKGSYKKYFAMDHQLMEKVNPVIQFGLLARAVVFSIIAFFFAYATWTYDPQKARGLDAALEFLQSQSYGVYLLGVIALGLIAFGIYSFLEGIYRRIHPN